ncbi:WIAG-tail domain [Paenibacillus dakarensis]|uniref:WIAG-tail domain n=1 Tax=Paenibacillus dakarensis TaxID=1527293 RepID=UPI0006D52EC5|nr:WIAG-tail domain [Paenibacillus dakarensis]
MESVEYDELTNENKRGEQSVNKVRRNGRGRKRSLRRYNNCHKRMALRGMGHIPVDDDAEQGMADDSISASHLQNRSVRSEAIEDNTVYSIHLTPESVTTPKLAPQSVTSSKLAPQSILPAHLAFTPVQGMLQGGDIIQQFGHKAYSFTEEQEVAYIHIPLSSPYTDASYVIIATCSHPEFYACVMSRRAHEAVIGISRPKSCLVTKGELSWLAIGVAAP